MNKKLQIIIRISLLLIMVIVGFFAVFPQAPDLIDFIVAEKKQQYRQSISTKQYRHSASAKKSEWNIGQIFKKNIAPERREIEEYLLRTKNLKRIVCIGKTPKIVYYKDENRISPSSPEVTYQLIRTFNNNQAALETGKVFITPDLHKKGDNIPSWLFRDLKTMFDSNRLEGWKFSLALTPSLTPINQTILSTEKHKPSIVTCDF